MVIFFNTSSLCIPLTFILRTSMFIFHKDDLSFQKSATQSLTYHGPTEMYGADNAVDRDTSTCMRTDAIGPNCPYKRVWWKVDLGGVYTIYSVNILFKNYDGYGMFRVATILHDVFFSA